MSDAVPPPLPAGKCCGRSALPFLAGLLVGAALTAAAGAAYVHRERAKARDAVAEALTYGQASRAVPPRVESRDLDAAREAAAVEVRDQAGERAEEGRLPGARTPEHQRDLSRDQVRGHVPKRWCRGAGVREGNLLRDS